MHIFAFFFMIPFARSGCKSFGTIITFVAGNRRFNTIFHMMPQTIPQCIHFATILTRKRFFLHYNATNESSYIIFINIIFILVFTMLNNGFYWILFFRVVKYDIIYHVICV